MFYKLKTDLPTFKAGDLFYLDENGSLRHKEKHIIAYHHSTLAKFPDALEKFWEPVEQESKRWRADSGRRYYFVSNDEIDVRLAFDDCDRRADGRYRYGNYFQTKEEAQAVAAYLKALAVVRDDAKGFVPDWSDIEQEKWYVRYSHDIECLFNSNTEQYVDNGVFGLPYFETEEDARASIDKHEKEWLTIFGVKEMEGDDE